jgi:LacI family transcriptional regulator
MKQIAAEAGVSMMTVSRVLRNEPSVSPRTKALVLSIADRLGYKRNRLVSGIQSGRSGIVALVVPGGHVMAPSIMAGAYDCFNEKDRIMAVDLVHGNLGEQAFTEQVKLIDRLLETRVDGILLLPVNEAASPLYFKEVVERNIPLVLVDRNTSHFTADFVGTDDFAGGREAARVLVANGCKRAVLISTGPIVSTSRMRVQGFRAGLAEFGLTLTAEIIAPNFTANTELIDQEMAKYQGQFDCVFGVADSLAVSAWRSCQARGLKVPEQVKVLGFGALDVSDPRIALSSFDQDPYQIGRNAAELLMDRIESEVTGDIPTRRTILTMPRFVAGASCAAG